MPELSRPHAVMRAPAVPATPTSALRAVAVLLAVVLLVAAAVMVINVVARQRTDAPSPPVISGPPSVSHAVLIAPLPPTASTQPGGREVS